MRRVLRLARPQFLISGLSVFIIGSFWAVLQGAAFSFNRLLLGYLILLPAQLAVAFSNDYFDVEVDRFGTPSLLSGGSGILVEHPELRKPALGIAVILNIVSLAIGMIFVFRYSYPIWFMSIIVLSNLIGWLYSAPPLMLAYRGFGEWVTAFATGFLVPVTGFLVMSPHPDPENLLFTVPLVFFGMASILVVEIPDMEADRLGHKKTWVAQRGRHFGFIAIALSFLLATSSLFVIPYVLVYPLPLDFHLLAALSLFPLGMGVFCIVKQPSDRNMSLPYVNRLAAAIAIFFILTDVIMVVTAAR